jgi:hypothetical protein
MIDPAMLIIEELSRHLRAAYLRDYGLQFPEYPNIAVWSANMSLSIIANSDALYHDVEHSANVTQVGLEIIRGKQLLDGGVSPEDWLHFVVALVCHDIGYVRGLSDLDGDGVYATGRGEETVALGDGGTDAVLTPYHVDRGKWFVRDRFTGNATLDAARIADYIERTRFPVPRDDDHRETSDFPGLLRAADLIGQLANVAYLQKLSALFYEFQETGVTKKLGVSNPGELRRDYPSFFWKTAYPYLKDGLVYLKATAEGRAWISNLYSQVFAVEHGLHDRRGSRRRARGGK